MWFLFKLKSGESINKDMIIFFKLIIYKKQSCAIKIDFEDIIYIIIIQSAEKDYLGTL